MFNNLDINIKASIVIVMGLGSYYTVPVISSMPELIII